MVTPVCGVFFSRQILSAQPVGSAHAVELADTHRDPEALSHQALDLATCGRRVVLTAIQHTGEHLSPKLRGVAVAPLDERVLAFTLDTLEESIHRRAMHRDRAASPCVRGSYPLLDLPNNLPLGYLACLLGLSWPTLVWCFWRDHRWHRHHFDHLHRISLQ
jgi:hypothetical protein